METLFIQMWSQLQVFKENDNFMEYCSLSYSIKLLIKNLIRRKLIKLNISDNYFIIVYGIETNYTYQNVFEFNFNL